MILSIDNLTIGEAKELANLFNKTTAKTSSILTDYIGEYVICRSRNEGINAGKVLMADDTGVVLEDARRLWYHKPANKNISWYEGVAKEGLSADSKIGAPVKKVIIEEYSLTICTKEAEKSIRGAKSNEQS